MRIYASLLMVLLFMLQPIPEINHDIDEQQISYSTLKATGVDLSVTEISYTYTNPTDQQLSLIHI